MYGTFYGVDAEGSDSNAEMSFESDSDDSEGFLGKDTETLLESDDSSEDDISPNVSENFQGNYGTINLSDDDDSSENQITGYNNKDDESESENQVAGYGTTTGGAYGALEEESESENEIGGYGDNDPSDSDEINTSKPEKSILDSDDDSSENQVTGYNAAGGYGTENEVDGYGNTKESDSENEVGGYGEATENEVGGYGESTENEVGGYGEATENEVGGYGDTNENEISGYGTNNNNKSVRQKGLKVTRKNQGIIKKATTKKPTPKKVAIETKTNKPSKVDTKKIKKLENKKPKLKAISSNLTASRSSDTTPESKVLKNAGCYWNTEFQHALDMDEGRAQWTKLAKLAHDFVYCSKTYGKIIITEYYLPEAEKTIKSVDAGGVAGGSKFICSNIFFKFALDTDLTEDARKKKNLTQEQLPSCWMYGGPEPDDYSAMKASKNDMTGLMSYYNAKIPGLYFPLMALIDYRGFRLIAMSILPISKATIRYGSADAGKTIHKSNQDINNKMKEAAELLNLKGHRTGVGRVMIWGPGDIEAHEGTDNKFYVVDFGRTFPPEAPSEQGSRKIFYCLLRPEFVRLYPKPLSSDAFSCWGKCNSRVHNQEVREATEYLYREVIPNFAKELISKKSNIEAIRLTESLHSSGINCRHFGRVRAEIHDNFELSELLMTEMVARLLSGLLRQLLRLEMKRTKVASQEPYKTVVIDFLNAILYTPQEESTSLNFISLDQRSDSFSGICNPRYSFRLIPDQLRSLNSTSIKNSMNLSSKNQDLSSKSSDEQQSQQSQQQQQQTQIESHDYGEKTLREVENCSFLRGKYFWTRDIKNWLETKFPLSLKLEEKKSQFSIRDSIDIRKLIVRLCAQSGIKLSKPAIEELMKQQASLNFNFQVLNFDLRKVSARVKHLNVIDEAEGNLLFLEARTHSHREGLWDATNQKFARSVCSNTNNPATFVRWGGILLKQCTHFRCSKPNDISLAEKLIDEAEEKFFSALKLNPKMHQAKFELGNSFTFKAALIHLHKPEDTIALCLWFLEEAMQCYYDAFTVCSSYYFSILNLADELLEQAKSIKNQLSAELRREFYLRAFYMIHCAVSVSPIQPDSSVMMLGGILLKEYLICGGNTMGGYLYGMASSYIESAFLKSPSTFDGQIIYYHLKSSYQIQRSGIQPNLSNLNENKNLDKVFLYKIDEIPGSDQQFLPNLQTASFINDIDFSDIECDFPLSFYPVLCEDPSSNYHQVRSVNRLFHLLGSFDWNTIFKDDKFDIQDNNNDKKTEICFHNTASTFVLLHSPIHAFTLTSVKILLPILNDGSRYSLPSQICFYGSNATNRWEFTRENLDRALKDPSLQKRLKMFLIHVEKIPNNAGGKTIDISIPSSAHHARFLVLDIRPSIEKSNREMALCKINFRGHQFHLNTLPHIIQPESSNTQLKASRALARSKISTSKEKQISKNNSSSSTNNNQQNQSNQQQKTTNWASASIRTSFVTTRLIWKLKNDAVNFISIDPTGQIIRTIENIDNNTLNEDSLSQHTTILCQATSPISYDGIPLSSKTSNRHNPLLRNRASGDVQLSQNKLMPNSNGPFVTLWIDDSHPTNETRTLCQLANDQSKKLELIQLNNTNEAIKWLEETLKTGIIEKQNHENTDNNNNISLTASSSIIVQKKESLSMETVLKSHSMRIIISKTCNNENSIDDYLKKFQNLKNIPIMIYDSITNPMDTYTFRQDSEMNVFSTNCARSTVEFCSFTLRSSDLLEIPRSRSGSGSHRLSDTQRSTLPGFGASKRTRLPPNAIATDRSANLFYYFEITIISMSDDGFLSVGLSIDQPTQSPRLGTISFSYGYQNDGTLWCGSTEKSIPFSNNLQLPYKQNDVIGCGYDARSQQIFWTKNGNYIGPAERGFSKLIQLDKELFPSICISGKCNIRANFGKTNFIFPISQLYNFTNPKLSPHTKQELVSSLYPFSFDLFFDALVRHNDPLLVLALIAQFSRTLNLLLRAHIAHWQSNSPTKKSISIQLLDSPAFIKTIPMQQSSYQSIDLSVINGKQRCNGLHLCALWSLMNEKQRLTLDISGWNKIPPFVFGSIFNPSTIQTLILSNCKFESSTELTAANLISERLTNLRSITLWSEISEQSIISICSIPTLRRIDFTDCINLNDSILVSAIKNKSRDSYEHLNFTNCPKITDVGLSQLVSKASSSIRGLKSLNLNYCDKISTAGVNKILHCCKQLQHIHLATNSSLGGMSENIVKYIAEEYNQKLQTLVLIRSTEILPQSMKVVAAKYVQKKIFFFHLLFKI